MINFESDYTEGCIPEILNALTITNEEQTTGYGNDNHCENARMLIRQACRNNDIDIHFLVGGTQTNMIAIASALRPYQGVITADSGHINVHETGAVEGTGHKCIVLAGKQGKIQASQIEECILKQANDESFEHIVQPKMVYLSFPTETGLLYHKQELSDIYAVCKKYHVYLYIDGARLGYGLASEDNDVSFSDLPHLCDMFYIGGTKVGALFGEALVIVHPELKKDFRYNYKHFGAMLAKGRMLGIQFEELFKENRYLTISKHAIDLASTLKNALLEKGYEFQFPPETNQLFIIMENAKIEALRTKFLFHTNGVIDKKHTAVRLVTSWASKKENIDTLIQSL